MKNIVYKFYFLAIIAGLIAGNAFAQSTNMGVTNVIFGNGNIPNVGTGIDAVGKNITCPNCGNPGAVSPCNGTPCTFMMTAVNGINFVMIGFKIQDATTNGNFGNPPAPGSNYGFPFNWFFTQNDGSGIPPGFFISAGSQGVFNIVPGNGWATITVTINPPLINNDNDNDKDTHNDKDKDGDNYDHYRRRHYDR